MLTILNLIENIVQFLLGCCSICIYCAHIALSIVCYVLSVAIAYIAFGIAFGFRWMKSPFIKQEK